MEVEEWWKAGKGWEHLSHEWRTVNTRWTKGKGGGGEGLEIHI